MTCYDFVAHARLLGGFGVLDSMQNERSLEQRTNMTSIQQTPASCSFVNIQFPENLVVIAGGAYSGRKTGRQIDESGHEATVMDVVVNVPDKPVALLLGSHEPTIWKIVHTPQTRIAAIVLSGYYTQVLNGISSEIPLLNST
ncbi:MAG: hypothetical protein IPK02_20760 [Candidatus Accumulibacter sp.]|uniref:Uncharacterized protein n=1 Tax=Candidatus Accumulibacter affinis TaxID=2954384 RepID=A0A935TF10_9PROT|nr:hypothetical protein [Candidatus Accumulibacter affinis]